MNPGDPLSALDLHLPPPGSRQRMRALHRQLKDAILSGRIAPGLRLPSTRALAEALGASRNAVVAVYGLLLGDGYIEAAAGSGHHVARLPAARRPVAPRGEPAWLNPAYRGLAGTPDRDAPPVPRWDFRLGVPDKSELAFDAWRRLSARSLRTLARRAVGYGPAQGQPALRTAIARHVSFTRAVACSGEDVLVSAGAQQAFSLLAQVLVTPGRTVVAVEHPGYPPARMAFEAAGARIVPVPVDEEGLVVERLPAEARVILTTPAHQFPLGMVMSAARRRALLAFAQRHGAVIVEDDYDGEFRFDGRALDALQTLDRAASVFFVGTFSKSLFPALRLGYVVAPAWARLPLVAAKERMDWHCNLLSQETLAAFIAEGHLARHVRRMGDRYARRRALLLERLNGELAPWLRPLPGSAGLHLAAQLADRHDAGAVAAQARAAGLGIACVADYGRGVPNALLLGYGAIDESEIGDALDRLAQLLKAQRSG
ncbi:MAG: PLP-dependent aminotransferase family protein [Pseudomonadota bacterium]|nr:PLP-dependent aminotransferase family protein [Pseudomonadota bacterium]